jgi:DNA-binding CsgD family transcriptional regulator
MARAGGWLGRAQRLVDGEKGECAERGYLLVPVMVEQESRGDHEAAQATAADGVELGQRFGEPDLLTLSLHVQGRALVKLARVHEGLGLLDEAMVSVIAGELSPIPTGLVYCSVIEACQEVYEPRRAREWTAALAQWCDEQPDLVAFTGRCLVHRAEIMQLHGAWPDALDEARRAGRRCAQSPNRAAAAQASYREGEVHRLRGEFGAAEEAYRDALANGFEPQPGLALLRAGQGKGDAAAAALRRALAETTDPLTRAGMLPAFVEVLLDRGELEQGRDACQELERIAEGYRSAMLSALSAHARGAVDLADGDPRSALGALRRASRAWGELDAPYEAARTRVLVGLACHALGDEDTAVLELEAARRAFSELGAAPDLARLDALSGPAEGDGHGLTARELEVLRLLASGHTNKAIAARLVLSERTVDRHVSNIFAKLRVPSRAAATAYAYEHRLL